MIFFVRKHKLVEKILPDSWVASPAPCFWSQGSWSSSRASQSSPSTSWRDKVWGFYLTLCECVKSVLERILVCNRHQIVPLFRVSDYRTWFLSWVRQSCPAASQWRLWSACCTRPTPGLTIKIKTGRGASSMCTKIRKFGSWNLQNIARAE